MQSYRILIVVIGVCFFGVNKSWSQDQKSTGEENVKNPADLFESGTYVSDQNDTLHYRLLKPVDFDSDKEYPLVVCLAGASARGTDNFKQIGRSCSALVLAEKENRKKYPSYVFVPQCPPQHNWGISPGPEIIAKNHGKPPTPGVDSLVLEVLREMTNKHSVDKDRLYLTGVSMGATGAWHYVLTHPQMFAAAIPVCGYGNPELAQKITKVPIWAFHSQSDEIGDVDITRNMVDAIKSAGGDPLYTEFSDLNHQESCKQAFYAPGLLDWLFAQKLEK